LKHSSERSGINPVSAGAGIAVPGITAFVPGFYIGGCVNGLSELCHKCV